MELSGTLGHTDPNVTNAVYVHEMKAQQEVIANILNDLYTHPSEEQPRKPKMVLL